MTRNRRRNTQVKTVSTKSSSPTTNLAANNAPNEIANNQKSDKPKDSDNSKDSVAMPDINDSPEPKAEPKDPDSPCKTLHDPNDAETPALVIDLLNDIEAHESPDPEDSDNSKDSDATPELLFDANDSPEPETEPKDPEFHCKTSPDPNDAEIPALATDLTDLANDIEAHESSDSEDEQSEDLNILEYIRDSNSELYTEVVSQFKSEMHQTLEIFSSKMFENIASLTSSNSSLQAEVAAQKIQINETKKLIFSSEMSENVSSLISLNSSLQAEVAAQKIQLVEMRKSRAESEAKMQTKLENLQSKLEKLTVKAPLQQTSSQLHQPETPVTAERTQKNPEKPTQTPQEIDQKISHSQEQQRLEMYWQAKLEKSANQLVFTNLKKSPETLKLLPPQIFLKFILEPMELSWRNMAKLTPTSVVDLNSHKPQVNSHLLLCTFDSPETILLLKQNSAELPEHINYNPKVPPEYTTHLKDFIKQQKQLKLLKNKNREPLVKSRLSTHRGHLILETAEKIGENWTHYSTRSSFMPQSTNKAPSILKNKPDPKYSLLQYSWPEALPIASQNNIRNALKKLEIENFSFNSSGNHLNLTVAHSLATRIENELGKDHQFSTISPNVVAHLQN